MLKSVKKLFMPLYFPTAYNKQALAADPLKQYEHKDAQRNEMRFTIGYPASFRVVGRSFDEPTVGQPFIDCLFLESASGDLQVIVQCSYMQYEVSLENYYEQMMLQAGEMQLDKRLINDQKDKPDILSQKNFPDGQIWVTRRTGYKVWCGEGAFVITVNAATNLENYTRYAELIYAIASSLQSVVKPEWTLAERLLLVSKRYPVDFATYIPISWKEYHHHNDTVDEMNLVYTKTYGNTLSGMASMCCVPEYKVGGKDEMLKKCHQGYLAMGADLSRIRIEKSDINSLSNAIKGSIEFPLEKNKPNSLLTFYLAKKGTNWVYMEMFGPAKETNFEAWALNDRALEIMKEKMVTA
jgi:hypothetical protein